MVTDWVEQQRQRLAENEKQLAEMKARLVPEQSEASVAEPRPPITTERLRMRRYWLVVALAVVNCVYFLNAAYRVSTWPSSASLILPGEQVTVLHDATGRAEYEVQLPLKEFPYEMELQQHHRFDLLWLSSINLLLIVAILHSYWQQSRLEQRQSREGPAC